MTPWAVTLDAQSLSVRFRVPDDAGRIVHALQDELIFSSTATTGPDGVASFALVVASDLVVDDPRLTFNSLALVATTPVGEVVPAALEDVQFFRAPLGLGRRGFGGALLRPDHSAAAPGAVLSDAL